MDGGGPRDGDVADDGGALPIAVDGEADGGRKHGGSTLGDLQDSVASHLDAGALDAAILGDQVREMLGDEGEARATVDSDIGHPYVTVGLDGGVDVLDCLSKPPTNAARFADVDRKGIVNSLSQLAVHAAGLDVVELDDLAVIVDGGGGGSASRRNKSGESRPATENDEGEANDECCALREDDGGDGVGGFDGSIGDLVEPDAVGEPTASSADSGSHDGEKPAARAGSGGEEPSAGDGSDGGGDDFAGLGAYDGGVAELVVEEVVDGKVVEVGDDVGVVIDDVSSDSGSGNLLAASGSGGSGGCLGGGSGGFCGGGSGDGALCGELSVELSGGVGVGGRRAARRGGAADWLPSGAERWPLSALKAAPAAGRFPGPPRVGVGPRLARLEKGDRVIERPVLFGGRAHASGVSDAPAVVADDLDGLDSVSILEVDDIVACATVTDDWAIVLVDVSAAEETEGGGGDGATRDNGTDVLHLHGLDLHGSSLRLG